MSTFTPSEYEKATHDAAKQIAAATEAHAQAAAQVAALSRSPTDHAAAAQARREADAAHLKARNLDPMGEVMTTAKARAAYSGLTPDQQRMQAAQDAQARDSLFTDAGGTAYVQSRFGMLSAQQRR